MERILDCFIYKVDINPRNAVVFNAKASSSLSEYIKELLNAEPQIYENPKIEAITNCVIDESIVYSIFISFSKEE